MTAVSAQTPALAAPPRWARRAAVLAVLTTVPSGLWRTAMAVGVPVGVDATFWREHYRFPGWGTAYVFGLSLLLMALALLTLGLVSRWGEVAPRWIPHVGGRHIPRLAAILPAGAGAMALTLLWASALANLGDIFVVYGLHGVERIVVIACYMPLLLWGPLLAALTFSYAQRTRSHRPLRNQGNESGGAGNRPSEGGMDQVALRKQERGWCPMPRSGSAR